MSRGKPAVTLRCGRFRSCVLGESGQVRVVGLLINTVFGTFWATRSARIIARVGKFRQGPEGWG